jgi:hypothetical protein
VPTCGSARIIDERQCAGLRLHHPGRCGFRPADQPSPPAETRSEVRWDPLLLWVAALVLLTQVQIWWSLAGERQSGSITIGAFLPLLVLLVLLFLLAAASLPDELDLGPMDLRFYYARQSRYIWTLYALSLGWLIGTQAVQGAIEQGRLSLGQNADEMGIIEFMASMAIVRRRAWHAVGLAVLTYTGPVGWLARSLG